MCTYIGVRLSFTHKIRTFHLYKVHVFDRFQHGIIVQG